jgi:hypothetical protein
MKSVLFSAAAAAASIAGCQAPAPSQPQPARCVVWAGKAEVIPASDPRQVQLDGTCQLNLIGYWSPGECPNYGGHGGPLPDTCYDVDY